MAPASLKEAWESLSEVQRQAAEWAEGTLLLLAGPGSGKTRVLTSRIARILAETPESNFRILGLTFTNKAAHEMRERVEIFSPGEYGRLFLGTFHSFCADVLRQHGTHLGIKPNFVIYSSDTDLEQFLAEAVENARSTSALVSELDKKTLPVIKRLKAYLIPPERCQEAFTKNPEMGARMSVVYPAYESQLQARNALDFESLIFQTYRLFTNFPVFAKRYRTVYHHICIDEFQDTNVAQYQLIRALTGDQHHNLFIVADDDQIIYQWNGASHKRLQEFVKDYSPQVLQLPMNYRCPPEVVQLANNLIAHNFLRTESKAPLQAFQRSLGDKTVRVLPMFETGEEEAVGVARDILAERSPLIKGESVVVLARNRRLLAGLADALHEQGVKASVSVRKADFESAPFMWLHSLLRLANERQSRGNLEIVCGTFSQLTKIEIDPDGVIAMAEASNGDYLQHWVKRLTQEQLPEDVSEVVQQISVHLGEGRKFKAFIAAALDWFAKLAAPLSGAQPGDPSVERFAGYDEEVAVWAELQTSIYNAVGHAPTLEAFLQELQMRSKEKTIEAGTVILMSIHSAKGKEFDHVYLVGLVEDELPSFQSKQKGDQSPEMEEERRNCFVAITRSKRTLTLSYAARYRGWMKQPSRFLLEMGAVERS